MNLFQKVFDTGFIAVTILVIICAFVLVGFAVMELWHIVLPSEEIAVHLRFGAVLETIGLLTIAMATLELGQTIYEEEVKRHTQVSLPTRVRRFLSRFMIVVIVSLSIEFLVAIFRFLHDEATTLSEVSSVGLATAGLLVAWGAFIWFNLGAERLEPEAIEQVKREDASIDNR